MQSNDTNTSPPQHVGSTAELCIESGRELLRAAQAKAVMPLIGPLLDAWECCSQDVRGEHPELDKQLRRINRAMEDAGELHNTPINGERSESAA